MKTYAYTINLKNDEGLIAQYIDHHRTLTSDLRILVRTVPAVLSGEGAY